jgi:HEAT repeat protein
MTDPTLASLLAECGSIDPERATTAIDTARRLGLKEAIKDIAAQTSSPHSSVRQAVVTALAALGHQQREIAGPVLLRLLADPEVYIRAEATDGLGVIGYAPAVGSVAERLRNDAAAVVRAAAAETLGDLGDSSAVPDLLHALDDADRAVRGYAANALGLVGTAESIPLLESRVAAEASPATQAELYGALYRLGAAGALASLLNLITSADDDLAPNLLNVVEDLVTRRQPRGLPTDVPAISDALMALGQRLSSTSAHVEKIRARLPQANRS